MRRALLDNLQMLQYNITRPILMVVYCSKSRELRETAPWFTTITPTNSFTTSTTPSSSTFSEDLSSQFKYFLPEPSESHDSQPLIAQTYDEELLFMQNFFANNNNNIQPSVDYSQTRSPTEVKSILVDNLRKGSSTTDCPGFNYQVNAVQQWCNHPADHCGSSSSMVDPKLSTNSHEEQEPRNTYLFSDLYLSRLLNGATTSTFPTGYGYTNMNTDLLSEQASSDGRKEMDLTEMVSSSHQFYR